MEVEILHESKDGTQISKLGEGLFRMSFAIQNKNIMLASVINFDLLKLIYDLNKDICEKVEMQKLDESSAVITILIKNFFEDLGLPQRYSCLHIQKSELNNGQIVFDFSTFPKFKASWLPNDLELATIDEIRLVCIPQTPHEIHFVCHVQFPTHQNIPAFVQKMSVMIVNKIINRLKQFIENVKIYI